jgi:SAM-dependent methyltransferase
MNPVLKIANNLLKDEHKVLEIGCGLGEFINELVTLKPNLSKVVAIDLYRRPESLNNKVEFHQQSIEDFQSDSKFDLVVMKQLFEHLQNPLGTVEKIKSLLNKHGKILIEVPNRRGFGNEAKVYLPEHGKHYFLWDKESLEYSLERLGFRCRFYNLYQAGSHNILVRYLPFIFRMQNPNLICLAMLDD